MKFRVLATVGFLCVWAIPANALVLGGQSVAPLIPPPPPTCPNGNAFPDGCPGAATDATVQFPTAFQPGGYFNTQAGTIGNYMANNCTDSGSAPCRPPWNVAGVEYPIGNQSSVTRADPATLGVPGCTFTFPSYGGGSPNGSGLLTCGGSSFVATSINGLELGPTGGHGCTGLVINDAASAGTTLTIKNLHFFNDTALCTGGVNLGSEIVIHGTKYGHIFISQADADGNGLVYGSVYDPNNAQPPSTKVNPVGFIFEQNGGSPTTIEYSYIHNFAGDPLGPSFGTNASFSLMYSMVEGWCYRAPACHAEHLSAGGGNSASSIAGTSLEEEQYSVILRDWYDSDNGPAAWWYNSTWNNPEPIAFIHSSHNVRINEYTGKMTAISATYACAGGKPVSGTATNPTCDTAHPDNIYYMTQGVGGQGMNIPCGAYGISLFKEIPGPYPVTTPPIIDEFQMEQSFSPVTAADYYPNFTLPGVKCLNVLMYPDQNGDAGVIDGHGGNPITNTEIDTDYIDATSQINNPAMYVFVNDVAANFTGNTDAGGNNIISTTTLVLQIGETFSGTGVGSCASGLNFCPILSSIPAGISCSAAQCTFPAGSNIPISPSITPILTPQSLTHTRQTVCTNPVNIHGVVSMYNVAPFTDTYMNQIEPQSVTGRNGTGC